MKRKFLLFVLSMFIVRAGIYAQTSCGDLNGYVKYKNSDGTGYYTLNAGYEEKAAQTYHYSGPGKISSVRVYGNSLVGIEGGVALRVGIYNVDNTGRPTTLVQSTSTIWWWSSNVRGYLDVSFANGGVTVNNNFAIEVELRNAYPWGNSFRLQYTGDGEGRGQDLASLAGTSTGGNWSSAKNEFNKDGDFYLVPDMTNYITSNFQISAKCIAPGASVNFTNTSLMSQDSMFNLIGWNCSPSIHYYEWNFDDGSAVSNITNPSHIFTTPGVYTVSLKCTLVGWGDTCFDTKTTRISVGLSAGTTSIVPVSCNGLANGSVLAVGTGGTGNYAYSLNGQTPSESANFTGLVAGNYTLYVADQLGCTATTNFVITQPTAITFVSTTSTNASCGNADGSILVTATGGAGSFNYRMNEETYQSGGSFANIAAGSYNVTAKDANACTASELVTVNDVGGPGLTLFSMTNVSCNNSNDGSILVLGSGGSGTLQYSINGGGSFQNTGSFVNLPAGNYAVMVKDAVGCSQYIEISIAQPQALYLTAAPNAASCYGGSDGLINVNSASGGTGIFTYSLNGTSYQSNSLFSGLSAGQYTVYVKDAAGCTKNTNVTVLQPTIISTTVTTANTTCYSGSNGTLNVSASGGTLGYSFSMDGEYYQPTGSFNHLSAGNYSVTIMDANHCTVTSSGIVNQPSQVEATINTTAATCGNSNGGLLAIASGGTGSGYMYAISSSIGNATGLFNNLSSGTYYVLVADSAGCGNFFPVTIADANGPVIQSTSHTNVSCNAGYDGSITVNNVIGGTGTLLYSINGANWQFSPQFKYLNAGYFVVTVKDANGCTGTALDTLTQPNPFTMSTVAADLTCYDNNTGRVTVYASGGSGVFAYSIDGGATYQGSNVFTDLSTAVNFVFVRDAAGCIGVTHFTLTQPSKLILAPSVLNVTCFGAENGAINLNSSGGTSPYNYSLNSDNYYASGTFLFLSGAVYEASVKDANGCITKIPVVVGEPDPLVTIPSISEVSCSGGNNGIIALDVIGGTAPYSFSWSNRSEKRDQFNLVAGNYSVTVKDNQGCTNTSTLQITQPAEPLVVNGVITNSSTSSSNDGSVRLTVTGGDGPYTFVWSNNATTQNISALVPANYSVNVMDVNGCVVTGIFNVSSTTGIAQIEMTVSNMTIYPNPASNNTTVEVEGYMISRLKVMNLLGQTIFESEPKQPKAELRCNTFSSGVYIVEVEVNNSILTKRIVISR